MSGILILLLNLKKQRKILRVEVQRFQLKNLVSMIKILTLSILT